MKQAKFIIPFAAAILLAGCSTGGETNSSSNASSAEPSTIVPVESSESEKSSESNDSEKSSESKEDPKPATITIDALKQYSSTFSKNLSKINGGKIERKDIFGEDSTTNYTYGSDENGDTLKVTALYDTYYVMKDGDGEVVTVTTDVDDNFVKADEYSSYTGVGPRFQTALEGNGPVCGAENYLASLVGKAEKNVNKDFAASTDGTKIHFSFGYYEDTLTVYNVTVDFTIGETLTNLDFVVKQYSGSDKYTFDTAAGTFTLSDGATDDGTDTFEVTQTVGTRTYTNDVDLSSFEFQTLALIDEGGDELDTINAKEVSRGETFKVYIEYGPDTANIEFDPLTWSVTSGDEDGLTGSIDYDYDNEQYYLELTAEEAGNYVVEVKNSTGNASADFALSVGAVEVKGISVRMYSEDPNGDYLSSKLVAGQTINLATTNESCTYFLPNVKTGGAAGAYTATITDSEGNDVEIDEDDDNFYFNVEDSFKMEDEWIDAIGFYSNYVGEYKLTISSVDDPTFKQSFTINVTDADVLDVLGKSYIVENSDGGKNTLTFKDYEEDHYAGTMVLTGSDGSSTEAAYTIENDGEPYSTFVFAEGDEGLIPYYLTYGVDGKLYYSAEEGGYVDPLYASDSYEYKLFKTWSGVDSDSGASTMTLTFTSEGIASGKIEDQDYTYDFKSEYTASEYSSGYYEIHFMDDGYALCENTWFGDESEGEYSFNRTGDWDKDGDSISIAASYLGLSFTLFPSED